MIQRYRMILAYDGSSFAGWQIQPGRPTIQGALEKALERLCTAPVRVHGSGRTDAGVHARGQSAHFDLPLAREPADLLRGLNALLDPAIRINVLRRAGPGFHARYGARGKEYRYFIWNAREKPPFLRHYRTLVRTPLDTARMARAASLLVGRRDFSAFAAVPGRVVEDPVRRLRLLGVVRRGEEIRITARGDGFLYKMVRSLAGFLIRVGEGALDPGEAARVLASRTRTHLVPTAPPEGLFLWAVRYRPWPEDADGGEPA